MPPVISRNLARFAAACAGGTALDAVWFDRELVACAIEHELGPILYWQLQQRDLLDTLEPSVRATLIRSAREAVLLECLRCEDMAPTVGALIDAGVTPVVFKGAAVSMYYPEAWTRPRGDTDLLVPVTQATLAAGVLERLGFDRLPRPDGRYVTQQARFTGTRRGLTLAYDLHWRISDPHVFADVLGYEELMRDSRQHPAHPARVPSAVHALMIACIHRIAHHGDEVAPLPLYDIDLVARSMSPGDWRDFAALAARAQVRAVCHRSLGLASALFGTPLPAFVVEALGGAGDDEPSRVYVGGSLRQVDALKSDLAALPGWAARFALLRQHVFPAPAYMHAAYGPAPAAKLPILYMKRFVRGVRDWCA